MVYGKRDNLELFELVCSFIPGKHYLYDFQRVFIPHSKFLRYVPNNTVLDELNH